MIKPIWHRPENHPPPVEKRRRALVAAIHERLEFICFDAPWGLDWQLCLAARGLVQLQEFGTQPLAYVEAAGLLHACDHAQIGLLTAQSDPVRYAPVLLPQERWLPGLTRMRELVKLYAERKSPTLPECQVLSWQVAFFADELELVSTAYLRAMSADERERYEANKFYHDRSILESLPAGAWGELYWAPTLFQPLPTAGESPDAIAHSVQEHSASISQPDFNVPFDDLIPTRPDPTTLIGEAPSHDDDEGDGRPNPFASTGRT